MKILLIGATGYIGRNIAAALLAAGHAVRGTSRFTGPVADPAGIDWVHADLGCTDKSAWIEHLLGVDAVVNCAGVSATFPVCIDDTLRARSTQAGREAQAAHDVYVTGVCRLLAALGHAPVSRYIHLSALIGQPSDTSRARREGEMLVENSQLPWCIVRPSMVFGGVGRLANPQTVALQRAAHKRVQWLTDSQASEGVTAPIHMADLTEGVLRLLTPPEGGYLPEVLDFVGPHTLTERQWRQQLARAQGNLRPQIWALPSALSGFIPHANREAVRGLAMAARRASPARLAALLGRAPRPACEAGALYPLTVLYDAECPLCSLEMAKLTERDTAGLLVTVNMRVPGTLQQFGVSFADANARLMSLTPDGQRLEGLASVRAAYRAAGLGWVMAPTAWPVLRPISDWVYGQFAKHRMTLSRWCGLKPCVVCAVAPGETAGQCGLPRQ